MTGGTGSGFAELFEQVHSYRGQPFDTPLVSPLDVVERLDRWAGSQPDAPCLTTLAGDGAVRTLSFAELHRDSLRMAGWLATAHGVRPGSVVAVLPRNDARSVALVLGVLRAGAIAFLIDPDERIERLKSLLAAFEVTAVLGSAVSATARECGALDVPAAHALADALAGALPARPVRPTGPALYFGTSGSTATSKIVAQGRYNAAVNAEAVRRQHGLAPGVRILGCLPVHHVNGLNFSIFATLWSGSHTVLAEAPRADLLRQAIGDWQPRVVSVVPTVLELLLLAGAEIRPRQLGYFLSAAAPVSAGTCQAVWDRFSVPVVQGYGLTETVNFSTTMPTDLSPESYRRIVLEAPVPPIGAALFGNEVSVLRPDGTVAEVGEQGEICVRGHNVMLEYVGNPEATSAAFAGGWFHTGDLGTRIQAPGVDPALFVVTGREKNIAKVMGVSVSLEELERVIRELPGVLDAACLPVADRLRGETIVAAVVAQPDLATADYRRQLERYFSPLVCPSNWIAVPAIPRTATGKIIRRALPDLLASEPS